MEENEEHGPGDASSGEAGEMHMRGTGDMPVADNMGLKAVSWIETCELERPAPVKRM
jgi:hypothetical protein